jgi:hypothetical protein
MMMDHRLPLGDVKNIITTPSSQRCRKRSKGEFGRPGLLVEETFASMGRGTCTFLHSYYLVWVFSGLH